MTAQSGDFDFRGYEVARAEFFDTTDRIGVTISADMVKFSTSAVRKFGKETYVEMLVHPGKQIFAVRSCSSENRNKIQWSKIRGGLATPRIISGAAFLPSIFDLFEWNINCKYRMIGLYRKSETDSIILFNASDTEVLIPPESLDTDTMTPFQSKGRKKSVLGYPAHWAESFGSNFYIQAQAQEMASLMQDNDIAAVGTPYKDSELQPTSADDIQKNIEALMSDMKQEADND